METESIVAGWFIDYESDGLEYRGTPRSNIAAFDLNESCWVIRSQSDDHPDANASTQRLPSPGRFLSWTKGADVRIGQVNDEDEELALLTADPTTDAFVSQSVSLSNATRYRASVVANEQEKFYICIVLEGMSGAGSKDYAYFDLIGPPHNISSSGATITDTGVETFGGGLWNYWVEFLTTTVSSPKMYIHMCDSLSSLTVDGDIDDAIILTSASLREDNPSIMWDLSLLDPSTETLQILILPRIDRLYEQVGFVIDPETGLIPHDFVGQQEIIQGKIGYRKATANHVIPKYPQTLDFDSNHSPTLWWCSGTKAGFMGNSPDGYTSVIVFISYVLEYDQTGAAICKTGDEFDWSAIEYQQAASDEAVFVETWNGKDYLSLPVNPNNLFTKISLASPHDYPNVWGMRLPIRHQWANEDRELSIDKKNVTFIIFITHGPWKFDENVGTKVLSGSGEGVDTVASLSTSDRLSATGSFWEKTLLQDRLYSYTTREAAMQGGVRQFHMQPGTLAGTLASSDEQTDGPGLYAHLILADAVNGAKAALIAWTEVEYAITGTLPYKGTGTPPQETVVKMDHYVLLKIGNTEVLETRIWRDGELSGPGALVVGLAAVKKPGGSGAIGFVWFEKLWTTAPSALLPGVSRGQRMHFCNTEGNDFWSIDSTDANWSNREPELFSSSDRHLFVVGFWLSDDRMITGGSYNWVMTQDGISSGPDIAWPMRHVNDFGNDTMLDPGEINGVHIVDSVKNSAQVALSPEKDRWPDRVPV